VEHRPTIGLALSRLGDLELARGDHAAAERLYGEALEFASGADEIARTVDRLSGRWPGCTPPPPGRRPARLHATAAR
jgi:hypothetical protein